MLLNQDFLLSALPNAKFYCSGAELDRQAAWSFYASGKEVAAFFDSRVVEQGGLFFALKGQVVDGHDFITQAIKNGAAAIVVSRLECLKGIDIADRLIILVDDTTQALIDMAKAWRTRLTCPVVGITGSIGKTSTKEILRSILASAGVQAHLTSKNQNTLLSLCTNILGVKTSCQAVVLEVGIDRTGEMELKADILRPTIAIITTVSCSHIKYFGNLNNIGVEKRQIFKNLGGSGVGIIPGDLPLLDNVCYGHPTARFGFKTKNSVQARKIKVVFDENGKMFTTFTLKWYGQKAPIKFNSIHRGMVANALAASTVAYFLHVPIEALKEGLESYTAFENRFEPRKLKDFNGFVISDCYNANPESMKAAILAFDSIKTNATKIAVIGDMLELGSREVYWHRFIGKLLNKASSIEKVVLVGDLVRYVAGMLPDEMILAKVDTWQEAEPVLKTALFTNQSVVLFKASHGIALDQLVDNLTR